MRVLFSDRFTRSFQEAPERVQREFGKQLGHLLRNLRHASLRAKKYDETQDIWQARVNDNWPHETLQRKTPAPLNWFPLYFQPLLLSKSDRRVTLSHCMVALTAAFLYVSRRGRHGNSYRCCPPV